MIAGVWMKKKMYIIMETLHQKKYRILLFKHSVCTFMNIFDVYLNNY